MTKTNERLITFRVAKSLGLIRDSSGDQQRYRSRNLEFLGIGVVSIILRVF